MKHAALACAAASLLSRQPLETRAVDDDPLAAATAAVDELRTGFEAFQTRATQSLDGLPALTTRLADLETRMNRPGGNGGSDNGEISLERRAFSNFLRLGQDRMEGEEARALIVGDDTKGGYLAPAEFQTEVLRGIVDISPIRQAVRVGSTNSGSVILPKFTGRPTASWVGEDEDRPETNMTYGQLEIPMHELACFIDVSLRLLEDSAINVDSEVATELSQEFALKESAAFSNGDGAKKPLGLQSAVGIAEVKNGHVTNLNPDALINMLYSLPPAYRNVSTWMMNGTTLAAVMKIKDLGGNYMWQLGIGEGRPSTLLGRPVIEDPTMPDIAANAFPIFLGDFNKAYRVYDRIGMSILRDPYTQATKGLVRFHARRRVGGSPVLTEALRKLKMAV